MLYLHCRRGMSSSVRSQFIIFPEEAFVRGSCECLLDVVPVLHLFGERPSVYLHLPTLEIPLWNFKEVQYINQFLQQDSDI